MEINGSCLGEEGKEGDLCKGNHRGEGQESRKNGIGPKNQSSSLRQSNKSRDNQEWSLSLGYWEGFPGGSDCKESACMEETQVLSLGQEDPLEKGMATHSSILAWKIPWIEEPGRLQSIVSNRVGHDWSNLAQKHAGIHEFKKGIVFFFLSTCM